MSDPRRYQHYSSTSGGGSSSNYPLSTYSSLANSGMSYPTTNQSNPAGAYSASSGQMYPSHSSGQRPSTNHPAHQQGYGSQPYGMPGPPISPESHFSNPGSQYPSTPYNTTPDTQWSASQTAPPAPGSYEMLMSLANINGPSASPYGSPQNYPYGAPAPGPYSSPQYAPSSSSSRGPEYNVKQCYHCRTTTTPLWRRDPTTQHILCNACGLYIQQRHALRPQELIDADNDDVGSEASEGAPDGPECSHCHTRQTSVWRRNKEGDQVCNACGVYQRLRGTERPLSLKRNKIRPRAKHPQT